MILAMGTVFLMGTATTANAIPFDITSVSFTPGSGYGIDANEKFGTLLDVRFATNNTFTPQSFDLNSVGQFLTFNFGTVNFQEPNSHSGITANEIDNLGVMASFTFTNPLGITENIFATGTAVTGAVSDAFVDYTLTWNPITVAFGSGGLFEIALNNLSFSNMGSQIQTATITLKSLPTTGAAVPEPDAFALFGIGLLGFMLSRRKLAKK